ncbi:MAG: 6-phosphofructokinase [Armatimonadota bacterium]|nr:MAG: 6-phosphofructokinase [Armatimonadota bacterium]
MRTVGVFTSGGDAPGMNACLRAVVRTALHEGLRVVGIRRGYAGMLNGEFGDMNHSSVSNIIQFGGTILKTGRSEEFYKPKWRARGAALLKEAGIEGLVAIGGDGTFRGAHDLWTEHKIPIVGVPATIDNDVYGTDCTIGYDSAVNTAVEAIDRIRDTATSHDRLFLVEVMGRQAGFIALEVGAAGGAEMILVPEYEATVQQIYDTIMAGVAQGKTSSIIVVAEGDEEGGALEIARRLRELGAVECRATILGHTQRGGNPTARDRVLASELGAAAVRALLGGEGGKMVGVVSGELVLTPLPETWGKKKPLDKHLYELAGMLAA